MIDLRKKTDTDCRHRNDEDILVKSFHSTISDLLEPLLRDSWGLEYGIELGGQRLLGDETNLGIVGMSAIGGV